MDLVDLDSDLDSLDNVFGCGGLLENLRSLDTYRDSMYSQVRPRDCRPTGNVNKSALDSDQDLDQDDVTLDLSLESLDEDLDLDLDLDQTAIDLDLPKQDSSEDKEIKDFLKNSCCTKACNTLIAETIIRHHRNDMHELDKHELELVIRAQLCAFRKRPVAVQPVGLDLPEPDAEAESKDKTCRPTTNGSIATAGGKSKTFFSFAGLSVCKSMFLFLHTIKRTVFDNISADFDKTHSVHTRTHKNTQKKPHNKTSFQDRVKIKTFIENVASVKGMPLPGRLPGVKDSSLLLLPSHMTKASMHR
jgi:hypothetical protein